MADFHRAHFHGVIEEEVKRYLAVLMLDPAKFHSNTREHCGRIMSRLAWDDASIGKENGDSADCTLTQMSVSGPLVNTMTPLWSIPWVLNPWKKYERAREDQQRAWWLNSLKLAKQRYLSGTLPAETWSFRYLDNLYKGGNTTVEQSEKDEEFASCMLGFHNLVGVVTICGPMQFFLMAMTLNPGMKAEKNKPTRQPWYTTANGNMTQNGRRKHKKRSTAFVATGCPPPLTRQICRQ